MRILSSVFIMALLPFFVSKEEAPNIPIIVDSEYCNTRYHFCVNYPDAILSKQIESDNGDGVILKSKDEKVVVTISGSRMVRGRNTQDMYNDFIKESMIDEDARLVYKIIFKDYYEVSFEKNGHQFYQKLMHRGNRFIIYQIVAPANQSSRINRVKKYLSLEKRV